MADDEQIPAPPEGFVMFPKRGPFSTHNGPYFYKPQGERYEQAFFALERHANGMGIVHGGMLSSFMDGVLAWAVGRATRKTLVTIHLSVDFLTIARVGHWVHGEAKVTRSTQALAFAEGRAYCGGHDVVRASGVFRILDRER